MGASLHSTFLGECGAENRGLHLSIPPLDLGGKDPSVHLSIYSLVVGRSALGVYTIQPYLLCKDGIVYSPTPPQHGEEDERVHCSILSICIAIWQVVNCWL